MPKYKVYYVSKENHIYTFSTEAKSEMEAIEKGHNQINSNGWQQYQYVYEEIVKL